MSGGLPTDPDDGGQRGLLIISRGTAMLLLCVYIAYVIFQLKTHASLFNPPVRRLTESEADGPQEVEDEEIPRMSIVAAGSA